MRSLLLGKIATDLAAKRSRIFSATTRSAGSSEARGSGTTLCSIALTEPVGFVGVASIVAAGDSLAGAGGADCPAGDTPVGTAVKSPHWKALKRATRVTVTVMPAKIWSKRGPFILHRSPRHSLLHRAFPKPASAFEHDCLCSCRHTISPDHQRPALGRGK